MHTRMGTRLSGTTIPGTKVPDTISYKPPNTLA